MKLLIFKLKVIVFSIPVYFIAMIGEYYHHETTKSGNKKFDFKEFNKWYWEDVKEALKYRSD